MVGREIVNRGDREFFTMKTPYFTIEGRSRAGHETWYRLREPGFAFDVGRCPDPLIAVPHLFITHAHLDHASGIPFYAGQRQLQQLEPGKIYVPAETKADFEELMRIHTRLEGTDYDVEFIGMAPGDEVRVDRTHVVRAHRSTHRVPARAYELIELRHHLLPEFAGMEGHELAGLRRRGVTVEETFRVPLFMYTGDTDRGILEQSDAIWKPRVLIIECSFVAEGHEGRAAKYRHIHFDDIAEFAEKFENELIVLSHFSRRYSREEIQQGIARRCPAVLRDRIRLALPEPWQRL